jgi:tetratricopeptide (TPR) repeat protein
MKLTMKQAMVPAGWWVLALLECVWPEMPPCGALLDAGDSAYAGFDNMQARELFARAFITCPERYDATMKMTRALVDAGEDINAKKSEALYMEALRYADTLRRRYPDSGQSYFLTAVAAANLAQIKKGMQRVPLAMTIDRNVRMSIKRAPWFAPAYVVLGSYCREVAVANPLLKTLVRIFYGWDPQSTLPESERTLQKALELSPDNIYAHLELARTNVAMGKKKEAIGALERMQGLPIAWHLDAKLKEEGRTLLMQLRK